MIVRSCKVSIFDHVDDIGHGSCARLQGALVIVGHKEHLISKIAVVVITIDTSGEAHERQSDHSTLDPFWRLGCFEH